MTRLAWLRGQLLGTLAVTALSAALFTAVLTWWLSPVDYVNGRSTNNGFDFTGVVPAGWALLAFAVGVLAGTALRRVIPAMAVTLAGYAAIRFPVEFLLRPRYLPPVKMRACRSRRAAGSRRTTGNSASTRWRPAATRC